MGQIVLNNLHHAQACPLEAHVLAFGLERPCAVFLTHLSFDSDGHQAPH
jgi:hypothetical protein